MTLFKFKDILSKYRDNVNTEPRLRNIQVKHHGRLYDIDNISEDSKGNIIIKSNSKNLIVKLFEYIEHIRFEFYWRRNRVEKWNL